jgi:site-specific recombinase XerC
MEADTNIHEVAVILGHTTVATTKNYIWSDIAHLKSAALEVPPYDQ